jgi:hypothetical protein
MELDDNARNSNDLGDATVPCMEPAAATLQRPALIPRIVARAFTVANAELRRLVLARLVGSVGTLALAVLGGGAFVKFLTRSRGVSVDDALEATSWQVFELASYVQQANPEVIEQILVVLAQDASIGAVLGLSSAAIVSLLSRKPSSVGITFGK